MERPLRSIHRSSHPSQFVILEPPARRLLDGSFGLPLLLAILAAVVLPFLPFPQNLVLVTAGAAFAVTALNLPLGIGVLVASVPFQSLGERSLGPINLTLTKVVLLTIAATWAARLLVSRRPVRIDRIVVTYAAYVLVLALSVVNAPSTSSWGTELYRWWSPLLAYLVAFNSIDGIRNGRPIILGTAAGVIAVSVVGIIQSLYGLGPEAFAVNGFTRAFATFGQPNPFAGYLELTIPLLVALVGAWLLPAARLSVVAAFGAPALVLAAVAVPLGGIALLLTQSRGGWLGAGVGLAAIVWLLGGQVRLAAVGLTILLVAFVVLAPIGQTFGNRMLAGFGWQSDGVQVTPTNFAVQERLAHWRAGWAMAREYPVLGVGAGNFKLRYRDFTPVWRFRISRGHAHNAYIQAAAQTGFIGLAAYLVLAAGVASRLSRTLRAAREPAARALAIGAIGVSLAFAVHNLFDYLHVLSLPVQMAAVWALATTAEKAGGEPARGGTRRFTIGGWPGAIAPAPALTKG